MKRLGKVFSGILAAAMVVSTLGTSAFAAADPDSGFVFPDGFEEAEEAVFTDSTVLEDVTVSDSDDSSGDYYVDGDVLLEKKEGCVADNAFELSSDGEFSSFDERFDNTVDGVADTYYVTAPGNSALRMANVYKAPKFDITLDSVSVYIGTPEYIRKDADNSGRIRFYLVTGFNGDLAKNYDSADKRNIGSVRLDRSDWDSWVTAQLNSWIISANTEYAIVAEIPMMAREIGPVAPATKGSFGSGTSFISAENGDGKTVFTDIADDSMRAALNVHVAKYVVPADYIAGPDVYVLSSCEYATIYGYYLENSWSNTSVLKSSPELRWHPYDKRATSYNIYRGVNKNGDFTYTKIASTKDLTYTDTTVKSGYYRYAVTAVVNGAESDLNAARTVDVVFPSLKAPTLTNSGVYGNSNMCRLDKTYGLRQVVYTIDTYDSKGRVGEVYQDNAVYGDSFNVYLEKSYEFYYIDVNGNEYIRNGVPKTFNAILFGTDGMGNLVCTYPSNSVNALFEEDKPASVASNFTVDSTCFRTQITVPISFKFDTYYVLRREASQASFETIYMYDNVGSADKTMVFNDTDIIPGKKYFYAVIAYNKDENSKDVSSYVQSARMKTVTVPVSSTPAKTKFTYAKDVLSEDKCSTQYKLIWDTVPGATSYTVYKAPLYNDYYFDRKNSVGHYLRYDTVKNFLKTTDYYDEGIKGYYFYVVPSINGKSLNGAAVRVYFESKMEPDKPDDDEPDTKFWISATPSANSVTLKWNPQKGYDIRIFRMGANDSVMRYIGYSAVPDNEKGNPDTSASAPNTFVDNTVEYGETYTYGAVISRANSYSYREVITETIAAKVVAQAKPVITGLQPLANAVDVAWGPVPGATRYAVYSALNGKYTQQGTTTETRFTAKTGLVGGVKYGFFVRAYVKNAWTTFTAADFRYATPYKFIAAPSIIGATVGNKTVTVSWEVIEGATKYALYTYDRKTEKYSLVSNAYTDTKATVSNLTNGKEYGFLVRAYGNGTWSEINGDLITYATPRSDNPNVRVSQRENGVVEAYWDYIPSADRYNVYTLLNGKYTSYGTITSTSYNFTGLKPGVKYGFLVRSVINGKLSSFTADDITYFTVSEPEYQTVSPSVTAGDKSVYLEWSNPLGSTRSAVYLYDTETKKYTMLDNAIYGKSYIAKGLKNDKVYGFLVRSFINGKWTSFTENDLTYAKPTKATFDIYANYSNRVLTLNINNTSDGVKATKYSIYFYRNNKFISYKTIDASSYSTTEYITSVVSGEHLGILVRGYINGAWSDYTNDDIVYCDIIPDTVYARRDDAVGNRVLLQWNDVQNATKYAVYTYDTETEKYSLIGTTQDDHITYDVPDEPKYTMDSFELYVLVRPYVNGAFLPFKNGTYSTVYVGGVYFYNNCVGIDNGFAVTGMENSYMTQYRVFVQNKTTQKYELKAETNEDYAIVTGLTNGEEYNYLIYGFYNGAWINLFNGSPKTVTTGMYLGVNVNSGSRRAKLNIGSFYRYKAIVEKYAVYTYVNGKYKLLTDSLNEEQYTITGLENGTKYGVLVRAYINGKWSAFTENDINYFTPDIDTASFYVSSYGSNSVRVYTYNDSARSYTKAYLYRYDGETEKYTLIDSAEFGNDYSVSFIVDDENARSYGYLVRLTDGKELTPFNSNNVRYLYD